MVIKKNFTFVTVVAIPSPEVFFNYCAMFIEYSRSEKLWNPRQNKLSQYCDRLYLQKNRYNYHSLDIYI